MTLSAVSLSSGMCVGAFYCWLFSNVPLTDAQQWGLIVGSGSVAYAGLDMINLLLRRTPEVS